MMFGKTVWCKLFLTTCLVVTFYLSGCLGLLCENIHHDLLFSSSVFSISFASSVTAIFRIYHEISSYIFG